MPLKIARRQSGGRAAMEKPNILLS